MPAVKQISRRHQHVCKHRSEPRRLQELLQCHSLHHFYCPGVDVLLWAPVQLPSLSEKLKSWFIGPYKFLHQSTRMNYLLIHSGLTASAARQIMQVSCLKPLNRCSASGQLEDRLAAFVHHWGQLCEHSHEPLLHLYIMITGTSLSFVC